MCQGNHDRCDSKKSYDMQKRNIELIVPCFATDLSSGTCENITRYGEQKIKKSEKAKKDRHLVLLSP